MTEPDGVVATTEEYYDSPDADAFYETVWGGEDIHIGLYAPRFGEPDGHAPEVAIAEASRRTVRAMADRLEGLSAECAVLDLGAGYGGSARYLAERFGCRVTCLNLSERQNRRNRELCAGRGLDARITVEHGNFEQLPFADASFAAVWSQDAFLHSGRRERVLREAARVLRPGGELIFTDPMQADDCPADALQAVYDRIHLDSMGSFAFYRKLASEIGLEEIACVDLSSELRTHYARVREDLERRRGELSGRVSEEYVTRMLDGLTSWVEGADAGWLRWGILHFRCS